MYPLTTAEHIEVLTDEYRTIIGDLENIEDFSKLRELLMSRADWSERGSTVLIQLAREYGSFVLANALALAEALEIEDGTAGI